MKRRYDGGVLASSQAGGDVADEPGPMPDDPVLSHPEGTLRLLGVANLLLDPRGHITQWSSGATRLFGRRPERALGRDVRDLLFGGRHSEAVQEALTAVAGGRPWSDVLRADCGGDLHDVEFRWEPVTGIGERASVMVSAARRPTPLVGETGSGHIPLQAGIALLNEATARVTDLTVSSEVEFAHRSIPAGAATDAWMEGSGDWYEIVPLPGGRVAFAVGDAMGHGTSAAAAAMVPLRIAVRTLAGLDLPPADVLHRLDRVSRGLGSARFTTCVYARYDPATRTCAVALAGHPAPILAHADGTSDKLELPSGLPLGLPVGMGEASFVATDLTVPEGSTLTLFSDGLVESRDQGSEVGAALLQTAVSAALADQRGCLESACDDVIESLCRQRHQQGRRDDVTLLLARPRSPPLDGADGGVLPAPS